MKNRFRRCKSEKKGKPGKLRNPWKENQRGKKWPLWKSHSYTWYHNEITHCYFKKFKICTYLTEQKLKSFIKDFFSTCDQIRSFQQIWPHLLKKSLMVVKYCFLTMRLVLVMPLFWTSTVKNVYYNSLFLLLITPYLHYRLSGYLQLFDKLVHRLLTTQLKSNPHLILHDVKILLYSSFVSEISLKNAIVANIRCSVKQSWLYDGSCLLK